MIKPIAIIMGEPNSISSEIIFKSWIKKRKFRLNRCLIIGNFKLLSRHLKYFGFNLKLKLISKNFAFSDINGTEIPVIDVKYNQKKKFQKISKKTNNFIFNCFSVGLSLIKQKKIFTNMLKKPGYMHGVIYCLIIMMTVVNFHITIMLMGNGLIMLLDLYMV